jgi:hypothetical protein
MTRGIDQEVVRSTSRPRLMAPRAEKTELVRLVTPVNPVMALSFFTFGVCSVQAG